MRRCVFLDLPALVFNSLHGSSSQFRCHFKAHCDERQETAIVSSAELPRRAPSDLDTRESYKPTPDGPRMWSKFGCAPEVAEAPEVSPRIPSRPPPISLRKAGAHRQTDLVKLVASFWAICRWPSTFHSQDSRTATPNRHSFDSIPPLEAIQTSLASGKRHMTIWRSAHRRRLCTVVTYAPSDELIEAIG
jgi:hypothetical protein